ncbi:MULTISPECIES: class I SAM-dependent methyltransferase [Brevibacillus]|uniref:class I SAM-dependent methyltransferase n=1 Tax=Brevibacillus TaxID=55080 RepID=UPI0003B1AD67|nr:MULTISPECIES: class I SAM-dependent methyltransferase [Brevibacillus]ERM16926.1 SAM-dependent methyltransferase [Brevibacillus laterosporus PE36]MCR8963211.1 class I SAM-dependent methyltransferase [Brevibacillus laterosporus]MCZ0835367.1 class I SAM-dependent methyltransferase [Brevibacillus halotolerans]
MKKEKEANIEGDWILLEWTGERIIPKLLKPMNGMLLEHLARYYFSTPYCRGRVLDIACGTGYGCHMVVKERKREVTELIGVDVDQETLFYANREYNHQKVTYLQHDALDPKLPEKLGMFDTILSFETIEHVADDQLFMENIYHMLKPGGTLVLSSPFGRGRGMPTSEPFHVHQLTPEEFEQLFVRFSEVEIYYQRGLTFEKPRDQVRYFIGMAVCKK